MAVIFMGLGTAHMGVVKKDATGAVISETPAYWEPDTAGGCVILGQLDPETMKPQEDSTEFFGDWDAASYLARVMELIHPNRHINVPDLGAMIGRADKDGFDVCQYCRESGDCRDCIVTEWKGEKEHERNEN